MLLPAAIAQLHLELKQFLPSEAVLTSHYSGYVLILALLFIKSYIDRVRHGIHSWAWDRNMLKSMEEAH